MQPEYKRADVSPCVSARAAPFWASLSLVAALVMGFPSVCAARVLGVKLLFVHTPSVAAPPPPQMRHHLRRLLIFQPVPAPVQLQHLLHYGPALECSCCADLRLQHHLLHFPQAQAQAQGGMNGGLGRAGRQAGRQAGRGEERKVFFGRLKTGSENTSLAPVPQQDKFCALLAPTAAPAQEGIRLRQGVRKD